MKYDEFIREYQIEGRDEGERKRIIVKWMKNEYDRYIGFKAYQMEEWRLTGRYQYQEFEVKDLDNNELDKDYDLQE